MRARDDWQKLGGCEFNFIPCINDNPIWVQGIVKIIQQLICIARLNAGVNSIANAGDFSISKH